MSRTQNYLVTMVKFLCCALICSFVSEFLIDRKKLPEKWQDNLREVKLLVRNMVAEDDVPFSDNVRSLLKGDCTCFKCGVLIKRVESSKLVQTRISTVCGSCQCWSTKSKIARNRFLDRFPVR